MDEIEQLGDHLGAREPATGDDEREQRAPGVGVGLAVGPLEQREDVLVCEEATSLLGRSSPIFDLGLFSRGDEATSLDDLRSTPTVIRLSQLPGDQVKNAVAGSS